MSDEGYKLIKKMMKERSGYSEETNEVVMTLESIINMSDWLLALDVDQVKDIDTVTLLKVLDLRDLDNRISKRLRLAIQWNRIDLVDDVIASGRNDVVSACTFPFFHLS